MLNAPANPGKRQRLLAALALVVWAPAAGELLTTATPPALFFIPWVFALYAGLYGLGALLIREACVRLRLAWPAVLLLGAAYGVLEEGLCAKSFFDAHWRAIGPLGVHGRWMDVNWIWAGALTLFHATYSIGLSIAAVHLVLPRARLAPWLGRFTLSGVILLFAFVATIFVSKGNQNYTLTAPQAAACTALIVLLVAAALAWPRRGGAAFVTSSAGWKSLAGLGFLGAAGFIVILYFVPLAGLSAWITAALLCALFGGAGWRLRHVLDAGRKCFGPLQVFGLLAGVYGFFIFQAPLQELNPARPDHVSGLTAIVVVLGVGLVVLGRTLLRQSQPLSAVS